MSESRIDRITKMESLLDEADQAIEELNLAILRLTEVQEKIRQLEEYYTGGQWLKDHEADEAGKIPADLKRGVLSEDAINDLLDKNTELIEALGSAVKTMDGASR